MTLQRKIVACGLLTAFIGVGVGLSLGPRIGFVCAGCVAIALIVAKDL